jgi:hypothetical protein
LIDAGAAEISAAHASVPLKTKRLRENHLLYGLGPCLHLNWWCQYANVLEHSPLEVHFLNGPPNLPELTFGFEKSAELKSYSLSISTAGSGPLRLRQQEGPRQRVFGGRSRSSFASGIHGHIRKASAFPLIREKDCLWSGEANS